jgi:hypothetical protein
MHVDLPEKVPHSVKEFLLQILTITIGILIALSLEALVASMHHRSLVREANANLANEMRANRRQVDALFVKAMPRMTKEIEEALAVAHAFLEKRTPTHARIEMNYTIAQLTSTGWTTAQNTGAVGLMEYAEVERLANVYELQSRFNGIQDRLVEGYVMAGPEADPETASPEELRAWRARLVTIQAHLRAAHNLARALVAGYDEALAKMK